MIFIDIVVIDDLYDWFEILLEYWFDEILLLVVEWSVYVVFKSMYLLLIRFDVFIYFR